MPRKTTIPDELVHYAYLRLFPSPTRKTLYTFRHVRWSGAADWMYAIQQLGDVWFDILKDIIAAYIFARLTRARSKESVTVTEVLERIPREDVVTYKRLLKKVDRVTKADSKAPAYALTILERHHALAASLTDPDTAQEFLLPVLEEADRAKKKEVVEFLTRYERRA